MVEITDRPDKCRPEIVQPVEHSIKRDDLPDDLDRRQPRIVADESSGSRTPTGSLDTSSLSKSTDSLFTPLSLESEYPKISNPSIAQQYWCFLARLYPELPWTQISHVARPYGTLNLKALQVAVHMLQRCHECLRATYHFTGPGWVRTVPPYADKHIHIVDVSSLNRLYIEDLLSEQIPFNLEADSGWRITVYRCGSEDCLMRVAAHRLIADDLSLNVILQELSAFYAAASKDQNVSLDAPLPLSDPHGNMHDQLQYERQLQYFEAFLDQGRPAQLLYDNTRPTNLSGRMNTQTLPIQDRVSEHLQRFCRRERLSPSSVLLAAFRATLYRLTGADDVILGTLIASEKTEHITEAYTNIPCLSIQVNEQDSFLDLTRRIHTNRLDTEGGQHVAFELAVRKLLTSEGDLSRHPLAQILFATQPNSYKQLKLEGFEIEHIPLPATSAFDLEVHVTLDKLSRVDVLYSPDLYYSNTITNMLELFHQVLEQSLIEPGCEIASLKLSASGGHALLDVLNLPQSPTTDYPRDASVVEMFRQQVASTPDRIAIKDTSVQLTYAKLHEESDKIAWWLASHSLAPETLVGVFASRSAQTIVAFMGVLKAGLAYLPLDSTMPSGRVETILSSISGHKFVLVGDDVTVPSMEGDVDFVPIAGVLSNAGTDCQMLEDPSAEHLAYVMFTSGSTGKPKGVMVEHRGIVRLVKVCNMADCLADGTTMAHLTSIGFDNSTWEIYAVLLNGGTLVCVDRETVMDCMALGKTFIQEQVKASMMTPTLLKQYLRECSSAIACLDVLLVQGEQVDSGDMFTAKRLSGGKVINAYGPTENTVTSTFYELTDEQDCPNGVPIGRALSNSGAYVMDAKQRRVPLGVIGELVVTGDGLARGYTDPQANIDRFVTIQIGGKPMKAYRTGDYVRHRPSDDQLEFFGRIDGQVKIRGNRVELGEIEHIFRSHACVSEAVVLLQESRLASFVTIRDVRPGSAEEAHVIETWLDYWDVETYTPMDDLKSDDVGRDFIGWTSTYDGTAIDRAEMNEWLDETISTILNGSGAGNVLEIGTGSGMIMFNLAEGLESYVGIDPSKRAVDFVNLAAKKLPAFVGKVMVHKASAGDIDRVKMTALPESAILNSVVQYFPSQDYLLRVLQSLINLGVKTIFVGDVRSYAMRREFLAERALFIAGEDSMNKEEFQRIMTDFERVESELLLDPAFFTGLASRLPSVSHVEILPKRLHATNELSAYRFAAVLHVNQQVPVHSTNAMHWINFSSREALTDLLESSRESHIAMKNIKNDKTILARCVLDELDKGLLNDHTWLLAAARKARNSHSLSAITVATLAQRAGWQVELSFARQNSQHGAFDAIFHRRRFDSRVYFDFPTDDHGKPQHTLSSQPLRRQLRQRVKDQLQTTLRAKLPTYMVPQIITFLDKMPVNQSSKIDRKALAANQNQVRRRGRTQAMSTQEMQMQQLWSQVLEIDVNAIGRNDHFFNIGGDSIAAMRVVSEARKAGIKMSVTDIFRYPVLHLVARQCTHAFDEANLKIAPFGLMDSNIETLIQDLCARYDLNPAAIRDVYPCTPLQEGLVLETLKRPGDYVRQAVIELHPNVSEQKLRRAWERVVHAKSILRTVIVQHNDRLLQVVLNEPISWIDATATGLEAYLEADKQESMNLGQQLSRYALIRVETGLKWLVWTAHHSLYDGWSLCLLQDAIYSVYNDDSTNVESGPQFQKFIQYIKTQDEHETTKYWQNTLAECECTPFPSLPLSVTQPIADTVIKHMFSLPQGKCGDVTISNIIRAAWALVMGQMTNSEDVLFGMTLYGRNAPVPGLDKMTAPTIATVPIRIQTDTRQTCGAYLARVQFQATEMIPFEQTGLQNIARINSDACKFQTQLVIQPEDKVDLDCPFGEWQVGSEDNGFTTYALTVELWLSPETIKAIVMFDSRAIKPWLARRILERFELVMCQLMEAHSTQSLSEIRVSVPQDEEQIWSWNETTPACTDKCLDDMIFAKTVILDAPALFAWDGQLTYRRLNELSSQLANRLVSTGVAPGVLVPLYFEKSVWTVVAIISIVKAGGGFVLLEPSLPEQRLRGIVQQIGADLILSSQHKSSLASRLANNVIVVDANLFTCESRNPTMYQSPSSSSPLYVVFTSGSTGVPKGVVISYGNMASALHYQVPVMGLTSESRLFDFASYSFDVSISNIFTVLTAGGCLCIPSDEDRQNNLEQTILSMNITALDLTPSVARTLSPERLPEVKSLTLGGEPLRATDIRHWWDRKDVQIRNAYGPSECTPTSTINNVFECLEKATEIGKGVGAVTWIVDPNDSDKLLPPGCIGELLLEGPLVGHGYLNDTQKTASAFIEDPVWLRRGTASRTGRTGRLYKTGDLVRYNESGSLTYIGRKDAQVKVRGQRVELGEIESVLRNQEDVDDAAAVLQHDGQSNLVAFVTICGIGVQGQTDDDSEGLQQVQFWENQFEGDIYSSIDNVELEKVGRDFVGWTSMINGNRIEEGEMNEWLNDTIETITRIGDPRHVLEIGTGSGMILFNLPEFESYVGIEPSETAVAFTMKTAKSSPTIANKVKVFKGTATDVPRLSLYTPLSPDLVIINSVLQYFPTQHYLLKVIRDIIQLGTVKTIFFGDVRSHTLHREFLIARALHLEPHASRKQLRQMVENLKMSEPELLVDPGFFTGLINRLPGQISYVEILPKMMQATNELSCYRYAAVVYVAQEQETVTRNVKIESWIDFRDQGLDHQSLRNLISDSADYIAISNIPNSKLRFERAIVDSFDLSDGFHAQDDWLSRIRREAQHVPAMSAKDLADIAQELGVKLRVSWARQFSQRGNMDAIFYRCDDGATRLCFPADHEHRICHSLSSHPLQRHTENRLRESLAIRLQAQLPSYMIPQAIVILDRIPLNKNGKVDRQALLQMNQIDTTQGAKRPPTTRGEKEMQRIWATVFDIELQSIGLDDGFMQLGGNSLAAMRVVNMARQAGIQLKIADLFSKSTTTIQHLLGASEDSAETTPASILARIDKYDAWIASMQAERTISDAQFQDPDKSITVLLTGANGFIGTQILRQLLEHRRVARVIAVVRGETLSIARRRTINAARRAQWWTAFHEEMLEIWLGDLSLPQLGLDPANWRLLGDGKTIDVFIHNGASVHFIKTYAALEAVNVASTADMLQVATTSPHMKFVYVSSARHQDPEEENEQEVVEYLVANSNGYSQTKYAAESLVRRAAARDGRNRFVVVSPGLVIGTPTEGVANADDWIWRMAAACIRVGAYYQEYVDMWIPVSDASATTTSIVDAALKHSPQVITQVKGGMTMGDFWSTLATAGHDLKPQATELVNAAIRKDIEDNRESHPLWALSDMLESLEESQGTWAASWRGGDASLIRLRVAVQKSAAFLSKVKFLPCPDMIGAEVHVTDVEAFTRSGV